MNIEERNEYVKYRIETAKKTFDAAKLLAENDYWNSVVNRLYYSVFYAVNALLVMNEIQTKSHSATKSQFSLHFIKTGKFDKKLEDFYQNYLTGDKKVTMTTSLTMIKNHLNLFLNRSKKCLY